MSPQKLICACPEPAAHRLDEPMHTHDGCLVYHTGATCALKENPMKSLPEIVKANGKDPDVEIVHGNPVARRVKKVAEAFAPGKRPKQGYIPGTEPKIITDVHQAIEDYVAARDARMELTKVEVEKKTHLLQVMKAKGITAYAVDGHEAALDVEETVKAKLVSEEIEEAEEREIHNRAIKPQDLARTQPPAGRKGRGRGRGAQV